MKDKYLIPASLFVSSLILLIGFYFITNKQIDEYKNVKSQNTTLNKKIPEVNSKKDHILGNKNAQIFVISYTDLECPFCKKYYNLQKKLEEKYKDNDKVAFVLRHFPLYKKIGSKKPLHPTAGVEAIATECAYKLGNDKKFWKMTEKIFQETESTGEFNLNKLPDFAENMGINKKDFEDCLSSSEMEGKILSYYNSAMDSGIQGTPTIFIQTKNNTESYRVPTNIRKIDQIISTFLENN